MIFTTVLRWSAVVCGVLRFSIVSCGVRPAVSCGFQMVVNINIGKVVCHTLTDSHSKLSKDYRAKARFIIFALTAVGTWLGSYAYFDIHVHGCSRCGNSNCENL